MHIGNETITQKKSRGRLLEAYYHSVFPSSRRGRLGAKEPDLYYRSGIIEIKNFSPTPQEKLWLEQLLGHVTALPLIFWENWYVTKAKGVESLFKSIARTYSLGSDFPYLYQDTPVTYNKFPREYWVTQLEGYTKVPSMDTSYWVGLITHVNHTRHARDLMFWKAIPRDDDY